VRNGAFAREALRDCLNAAGERGDDDDDWSDFDASALETTSPGENVLLPFFAAETTPRGDFVAPVARGSAPFMRAFERAAIGGTAEAAATSSTSLSPRERALLARALVEGQALNLRLHAQRLAGQWPPRRLVLTGGASKSDGVAQVFADVFDTRVERSAATSSAALGAAMLAAVLGGGGCVELAQLRVGAVAAAPVEPEATAAATYDTALLRFEALMNETLAAMAK
jgi:sugar (pentulose or hexulose) kinase